MRDPSRAEAASDSPRGVVGQLGRFALIGVASTLAYAALYWVLRSGMSAQWANAVALMLTAVGNTAANRSFTFGVRGRPDRLRHQAQGLVVFGIGLAVTGGALMALDALAPDASRPVELVVLTAANVLATLIRFLLYRAWVFGDRLADASPPAPHAVPAALSTEVSR